jgi:hypothetical protein
MMLPLVSACFVVWVIEYDHDVLLVEYILGVLTTAIVSLQLVLLVLLDPISGKHYCVEYIYDLKREKLVVN